MGLCSHIFVLYGSQTGNAEHIARELHEKLTEEGMPSVCNDLNSYKKIDMRPIARAVLIVCSTTGNGDCPENGEQWWRCVKLRSVVSLIVYLLHDY